MKKSKILLIAAIIGTICAIICFSSVNSALDKSKSEDTANQIGTVIGASIVMPSVVLSAIGTIFAWVGFGTNKKGFALTAGILYSVAVVMFFPWFMFNIVQMILSYIAYGTMGKVKKGNGETETET